MSVKYTILKIRLSHYYNILFRFQSRFPTHLFWPPPSSLEVKLAQVMHLVYTNLLVPKNSNRVTVWGSTRTEKKKRALFSPALHLRRTKLLAMRGFATRGYSLVVTTAHEISFLCHTQTFLPWNSFSFPPERLSVANTDPGVGLARASGQGQYSQMWCTMSDSKPCWNIMDF